MNTNHLRHRLSHIVDRIGVLMGIDAQYFVTNTYRVSLAHGINVLKGLITGYLVTRLFPKEMYGEYRLVMYIVGVVGMISLSGLPTAIARSVARDSQEAPLRCTMQAYAIFCLLGSVVLLLIIPFLHIWNRIELWPMFVIEAILFVPTSVGTMFFGGIVTGKGEFKEALRATTITSACVALGVLLMLFIYPSATLLLLIVNLVPAIVYLRAVRRMMRSFPSKQQSWKIMKAGISLTIASLPLSISSYLDGIIIAGLFGTKELATYAVAILIPEQIKLFFKELLPIAFSRQAIGEDSQERRQHMMRIVVRGTLLFTVIIAAYIALMPLVIPWLFPQYDAHAVFALSSIATITLITVPATLFVQNLEARGNIAQLQITEWTSTLGFISSLLLLTPTIGIMGAIVSRGVFRLMLVTMSGYFVLRKNRGKGII